MLGIISTAISLLALAATLYELHLQRTHNEKSLRPLGQIDLLDRQGNMHIYIRNNGMGPLIIDRLTFNKGGRASSDIEECLDLDPRSYMSVPVSESMKRVILPNSHFVVFEANRESGEEEAKIDNVRNQLSSITLKVEGRDIYDNEIVFERDFQWFNRYRSGKHLIDNIPEIIKTA